ncbi:MAG: hypothetical protein ACREGA_02285 [Candidatus Saccharimonadales bacterium]
MFKKSKNPDSQATKKPRSKFFKLGLPLAVIIILAIAAGLAYWYHSDHNQRPVASKAANSGAPSPQTASASQAPANPYKGWQQFCGAKFHFCFKYPPSGWQLSSSAGDATLTNSAKSATINYTNPQKSTNTQKFTTVSTSKLYQSNVPFTVVGGFATDTFTPSYSVADPLSFAKAPKMGQSGKFAINPTFVDIASNGSNAGSLQAVATGKFQGAGVAKAWFKTSEAATSLKILQSTTYQPKSVK